MGQKALCDPAKREVGFARTYAPQGGFSEENTVFRFAFHPVNRVLPWGKAVKCGKAPEREIRRLSIRMRDWSIANPCGGKVNSDGVFRNKAAPGACAPVRIFVRGGLKVVGFERR